MEHRSFFPPHFTNETILICIYGCHLQLHTCSRYGVFRAARYGYFPHLNFRKKITSRAENKMKPTATSDNNKITPDKTALRANERERQEARRREAGKIWSIAMWDVSLVAALAVLVQLLQPPKRNLIYFRTKRQESNMRAMRLPLIPFRRCGSSCLLLQVPCLNGNCGAYRSHRAY